MPWAALVSRMPWACPCLPHALDLALVPACHRGDVTACICPMHAFSLGGQTGTSRHTHAQRVRKALWLGLGPGRQAAQEGKARLELIAADELVCGMGLSNVAGTADDGGRTASLEQAGFGAIGDGE